MNKTKLALAILAGFPLSLSLTNSVLAQSASSAPQAIEAVEVRGAFLGAGSKSAMKLDVPVRDTPFSVSSYTNSFMKAIETTNVADLYNYMTGVKRAGNTGYDMTIRGFKTSGDDKNAIMVDGLPGLTGRFGSPSVAGVDHIELVKGPASVLYGQAQPGGFVNIVSKKPKGVRDLSLDLRGTTYKGAGLKLGDNTGYNATVDATGPIDADGIVLYRLVVESSDRDLFRNGTYERGVYVAPMVTWNINESTAATLQLEHRESRTSFDVGLVAPNFDVGRIADIRTVYQEPGDYRTEVGETMALTANHTFANDITWNLGARFVYNHADDLAFTGVNGPNATTPTIFVNGVEMEQRRVRSNRTNRKYDYADTNFNIPFSTGPIKHKAIVGLNGGLDTDDEKRNRFFNSGACPGPQCLAIPVYNPVHGIYLDPQTVVTNGAPTAATLSDNNFRAISYGLYLSDLVTLTDQWKLSVGLRRTHETQRIQEVRFNGPVSNKTAEKTLPLAGLLYQPTQQLTFYTSYSTSYVPAPANSVDVNNVNSFKPTSAWQVEVGAKAEKLLNNRLNATFSIFKIERKDTVTAFNSGRSAAGVACPTSIATCSEQLGNEESKGVEFEMNAKPIKDLQVTLGYTHVDAKVKSSAAAVQVGARLTQVPKNAANTWTRYDFSSGPLKGVGVGLGIVYTGERFGLLPTTTNPVNLLRMPSYTVVDLGLYYVTDRYSVNFKLGNVFDRRYIENTGFTAGVQVVPGAPRNLALAVSTHF